jgi:hypothetical protein
MARISQGQVQSAELNRYYTPWQDEQVLDAVRDLTRDPTPWAAYSLGYEVGTAHWHIELTLLVPQFGYECFDVIPVSAAVIRLSCDVLSAVMPTDVATRFLEVVNDMEAVCIEAKYIFHEFGRFEWDDHRSRYLADRLPVLLRSAVPANSPLLSWLNLGQAIGEFIYNDPAPCNHPAIAFRPVADAVRRLPKAERGAIPELKELSALIDRRGSGSEAGLRQAYVDRLAMNWFDWYGKPWPNSPWFWREIRSLHKLIEEHLLRRKKTVADERLDHVPRWDSASGVLMFAGKVIREVGVQAANVRNVLDLFEKNKWCAYVETAYAGEVKKDIVKSMNRRLTAIKFHGAGSPKGISWMGRTAQ